jgi:hypothetical protein
MKTFVTVKSDGSKGPKINAKDFNEAEELLKSMNQNKEKVRYKIVGEEIIIPIQ